MRALPLLLLLSACPDPTATPEGASPTGQPTDGAPPAGGPGAPGEGGPAGPPTGAPPPGVMAGRPTPTGLKAEPGQGIKIQGEVVYTGTKTGTLRVDFLRQAADAPFPELAESLTLEKPGPFEIEAPKDAGDFWVVAYLDSGDNGPDPGEPAGRLPEQLKIGSEPVAPLTLTLEDNPDLGKLKPISDGTPPAGAPPGAGAPPPGAPPAGGAGAPPPGAPPAGGEGEKPPQ
ncbi:MAG: hypothetical protein ACOZNI_15195 [Myxococcota bacterium]